MLTLFMKGFMFVSVIGGMILGTLSCKWAAKSVLDNRGYTTKPGVFSLMAIIGGLLAVSWCKVPSGLIIAALIFAAVIQAFNQEGSDRAASTNILCVCIAWSLALRQGYVMDSGKKPLPLWLLIAICLAPAIVGAIRCAYLEKSFDLDETKDFLKKKALPAIPPIVLLIIIFKGLFM